MIEWIAEWMSCTGLDENRVQHGEPFVTFSRNLQISTCKFVTLSKMCGQNISILSQTFNFERCEFHISLRAANIIYNQTSHGRRDCFIIVLAARHFLDENFLLIVGINSVNIVLTDKNVVLI